MKADKHLILAVLMAGIIFVVDLTIPLGVAFGVPYIIVILVTTQTPHRNAVIAAAIFCTFLVLLGLYYSPEGGEAWKVYFNRAIAVFAIWIVALLGLFSKEKETLLQKSEEQFRQLVEDTNVLLWEMDLNTRQFTYVSPQAEHISGYTAEQWCQPDFWQQHIHPDDRDWVIQYCLERQEDLVLEYRFVKADGDIIWFHENVKVIFNDQANPIQLRGVILDISERKQVDDELQKLSRAVEASSSVVIITNADGHIEYTNPIFTEVTGYSKEDAIGQNPRFLKSGKSSDSVYVDLWKSITSGYDWKGEFLNQKKDGSLYRVRTSISCVKDTNGRISNFVGIQDDITHEYELTEQLNYQASHDVLTGLINRLEFERRTERLLATIQHDKTIHALCFMDLDQFKIVNDTCGHTAGDEMLHQLGQVLQGAIRHRDTLARLGGDEFGVLMEHCTLKQAHRGATSLLEAIQDFQFSWGEHTFRVGVSIGLVSITDSITSLSELLKQADAACYMAKDLGRNRIHVYHTDDSELAQRHGEMQWVARLYRALEDDSFCLFAQQIVALDGSASTHYEILIRMTDANNKLIPPGAFLPAAERYNLISTLDRWVIRNTLKMLADNPTFQHQTDLICINLSGQSLADEALLYFVIAQLQETGIQGEKICFEITETAAITHLGKAEQLITTLREVGCSFALDDFGSGLSSFGYLKNLPVDYLKIDGMFVKDITDDPIDHAMVKSINEIGQLMGMKTIAEFVENDQIKEMLCEIGVNYAQGYGIGKPVEFEQLLAPANTATEIQDQLLDEHIA